MDVDQEAEDDEVEERGTKVRGRRRGRPGLASPAVKVTPGGGFGGMPGALSADRPPSALAGRGGNCRKGVPIRALRAQPPHEVLTKWSDELEEEGRWLAMMTDLSKYRVQVKPAIDKDRLDLKVFQQPAEAALLGGHTAPAAPASAAARASAADAAAAPSPSTAERRGGRHRRKAYMPVRSQAQV
mmetsp:Transcript_4879/g.13451  ORF Transcript_4879/g.13451 Transcript_4879/m.13451 type:complete len:185 (-) Transcript_4879:374-928(-)